jgi:hypothetical protein
MWTAFHIFLHSRGPLLLTLIVLDFLSVFLFFFFFRFIFFSKSPFFTALLRESMLRIAVDYWWPPIRFEGPLMLLKISNKNDFKLFYMHFIWLFKSINLNKPNTFNFQLVSKLFHSHSVKGCHRVYWPFITILGWHSSVGLRSLRYPLSTISLQPINNQQPLNPQ